MAPSRYHETATLVVVGLFVDDVLVSGQPTLGTGGIRRARVLQLEALQTSDRRYSPG